MPYKHSDAVKNRFVGKKIKRIELARRVAKDTGFLLEDVKDVLASYAKIVEEEVAQLNRVQISDSLTLFIDKMPGRTIKLKKLGHSEGEPVEFAFYIIPKLSVEVAYRERVKRLTAERTSRGEFDVKESIKETNE